MLQGLQWGSHIDCHTVLILVWCLVADIFHQGIWVEHEDLQDEELIELAKSLPGIALQGKAPSTLRQYSGSFRRWKTWALQKGLDAFPASPFHIALYLAYLTQKSNTAAPIEQAVHSISWAHSIAVVDDPTVHPLVGHMVAGAKRILARPVCKKEPITPEILRQLVESFGGTGALLSDIRTLAICLLSFAGFFRYDEVANLRESDVTIFEDHMEIYVESSKTDQYRDGARVVIARVGSDTCPVKKMERYISIAAIGADEGKYLFRGLVSTKVGARLRSSGTLSYTRVRELVLEMLQKIGLDKAKYGVHSLRSGGATAAANAGVPDRCFKRHGRWRSENAKDGYVKDTIKERLSVSQSLGL